MSDKTSLREKIQDTGAGLLLFFVVTIGIWAALTGNLNPELAGNLLEAGTEALAELGDSAAVVQI